MAAMLDISDHSKQECIQRLNLIIPEMPFIKSFADDCLLERLVNLISVITTAFDDPTRQSLDSGLLESEADREEAIRTWLQRYYSDHHFINGLNFGDKEDRSRVTVLIINILFKLRHSLKDIEQYLENCPSFLELEQQLSHITRFDQLLELLQNDSNRWRSEARDYKVKYDESKKLIDKYQQNEIFNYNCNPRNQNLYKSRMKSQESLEDTKEKDPSVDVKWAEEHNTFDEVKSEDNDTENIELPTEEVINHCQHANDSLSESFDDKEVTANDSCYQCSECERVFPTNYEMNLHLLQDHANISLDLPKTSNKEMEVREDTTISTTLPDSGQMSAKSYDFCSKRTFKCLFILCRRSFDAFNDLRNHFVTHQPYFDRLLSHIYRDSTTEPVLNRMRSLSMQRRKMLKRSNHNIVHTVLKHKRAMFNNYQFRLDPNAQKLNGKHNFVGNYGLTNGSGVGCRRGNNFTNASIVPIVSTPDIITHWDEDVDHSYFNNEDMDTEGTEDSYSEIDAKPNGNAYS